MKKTLIGLACVFALLTSCKEKSPEEKISDGAKEVQEGLENIPTPVLEEVKETIKQKSLLEK